MNAFKTLMKISGLSNQDAVIFLKLKNDRNIRSWTSGEYAPPDGVMREMTTLILAQEKTAIQAINQIQEAAQKHPKITEIELGYPADDYEAAQLGFPCVNAWLAMAGRVVAWSERQEPLVKVKLVPRGSTSATAKANEMMEK